MTDETIDALTGRELDSAVAVALGWQESPEQIDIPGAPRLFIPPGVDPEAKFPRKTIPFYSTDIAAAWELVEHDFWHWWWTLGKIAWDSEPIGWEVRDAGKEVAHGATAPEAISRAFLRAVRSE